MSKPIENLKQVSARSLAYKCYIALSNVFKEISGEDGKLAIVNDDTDSKYSFSTIDDIPEIPNVDDSSDEDTFSDLNKNESAESLEKPSSGSESSSDEAKVEEAPKKGAKKAVTKKPKQVAKKEVKPKDQPKRGGSKKSGKKEENKEVPVVKVRGRPRKLVV